ncbi:MAG: lactate utilization protein [Rhodospirillales bacterium]|nr:lactate utilization protein [Rhodospirillales bacterium]
MNDSRTRIMGRLKAALDQRHNPTVRFSGADQRMKSLPAGLIPKRGQAEGPARIAMFVDEAERAETRVVRLGGMAQVPAAAAKICQEAGSGSLKIAPHPDLQGLDWSAQDVAFGIGAGDDLVGLSRAYAGVAETGTLVLRSGADSPTTLNFLPDVHVVVILAEEIKANYEDVWAMLRAAAPDLGPMLPRTINWITGPSRTADIEQTILLGAHGPRKLMILLIDETA